MPEPHLFHNIAMLALSMWWTSKWLISRPVSRWRFAVSALAGAIAWALTAWLSLGSTSASSGVQILYGSQALAYFCAFMAFVSIVGIVLGLALWTEEEIEQTGEGVPDELRSGLGGD